MTAEARYDAGEEPGDDRGTEADEADRTGQGHRSGGEHDGEEDPNGPRRPDRNPEHRGGVVAETEQVQTPRQQDRTAGDDSDDGNAAQGRGPVELIESARTPGEETRRLFGEEDEQSRCRRLQRYRRGRARQHETSRRRSRASGQEESGDYVDVDSHKY